MFTFFYRLSRLMAYAGGTVLTALIVLTCLSILGRQLNTIGHLDWVTTNLPWLRTFLLDRIGVNEINGAYELTEAGMAFVIFAFIPLTQITAGHAVVDIFTSMMGPKATRLLQTIAEVLFATAMILIAVQLFAGMISKKETGQTSLFLQFPVWWAYAASLTGAAVSALVATYVAIIRVFEAVTGQDLLPLSTGAEH
ncbi:MAG: TRAP-type C4-dicarboxylate transport system, small permease component [Rhodobacteraceae bacterium HLUCCA08]|nr:MAG: TRAP-type C4-dicarboxylate transport system, small permease component [Rhodobacteraceae bacterium HLUCCA08]